MQNVCLRVEASTLSDIRTILNPSAVHTQIFKAILTAFHPSESMQGQFDRWLDCKDFIRLDLMEAIAKFDPTASLKSSSARTTLNVFRGKLIVIALCRF